MDLFGLFGGEVVGEESAREEIQKARRVVDDLNARSKDDLGGKCDRGDMADGIDFAEFVGVDDVEVALGVGGDGSGIGELGLKGRAILCADSASRKGLKGFLLGGIALDLCADGGEDLPFGIGGEVFDLYGCSEGTDAVVCVVDQAVAIVVFAVAGFGLW